MSEHDQPPALASIERIARGIAITGGVPEERAPIVIVAREEATAATYYDPDLTGRWVDVLRAELGAEQVVESDPVMGGEDFSRYGLDTGVPISLVWLDAVERERCGSGRKKAARPCGRPTRANSRRWPSRRSAPGLQRW